MIAVKGLFIQNATAAWRRSRIKQLKSFIQNATANAEHDFSLFYLDQRRQAAFAFCINRPLNGAFAALVVALRLIFIEE